MAKLKLASRPKLFHFGCIKRAYPLPICGNTCQLTFLCIPDAVSGRSLPCSAKNLTQFSLNPLGFTAAAQMPFYTPTLVSLET